MNVNEATQQINKLKKKLSVDLVKEITNIISHDVVGMIQKRVVEQNKDARGMLFSRYSSKPMLTSGTALKSRKVWRAVAGSKSKRAGLDWVTIKKGGKNIRLFELKGGYAELRRIEGFGNANKSFEFTGEMWRKFGVTNVSVTTGKIKITLGGRTTASQDKIDWNSEREGKEIIDISQEEKRWLEREIDKLIQGYVVGVKLN